MPFISVNGIKIHFNVEGNKCGTKLVFLHGWAASSEWWVRQVKVLSKDYRMILVDLPGHGLSRDLPIHFGEKTLLIGS